MIYGYVECLIITGNFTKISKITNINTDTNTITVSDYRDLSEDNNYLLPIQEIVNQTGDRYIGYLSEGAHVEGRENMAAGDASHAEGYSTQAIGKQSHTEGFSTIANGYYQHVQGTYNIPDTSSLDIVGNGSFFDGIRSNAYTLDWNGNAWYSGDVYVGSTSGTNKDEGSKKLITLDEIPTATSEALGLIKVGENLSISDDGTLSAQAGTTIKNLVDGDGTGALKQIGATKASGIDSFAEGRNSVASGDCSHSEGYVTVAFGFASHAEGVDTQTRQRAFTIISGDSTTKTYTLNNITGLTVGMTYGFKNINRNLPHAGTITAIDTNTKTVTVSSYYNLDADDNYLFISNKPKLGDVYLPDSGYAAHSEGNGSLASASASHAEGTDTISTGHSSHSEGFRTTADGNYSHSEGRNTWASGYISHAEGQNTVAAHPQSHAEGLGTIANGDNQHVQGKYNISDYTSLDIIGNGTSEDARSNAYTLDRNGNAWYSGDIYTGSTSGTNKDSGSKKIATEEYVDNKKVDKTTTIAGIDLQDNITVSELASALKVEILKSDNPIGHIRLEVTNTNPADYLGFGTWVLWGAGRVPVGVDTTDTDFATVEKLIGEKTHSLTFAEMPNNTVGTTTEMTGGATDGYLMTGSYTQKSSRNLGGSGQAHNNIQPSITCYMWKRVS